MKRKHKGRKIYKTKEKNYYGKSPLGKFLSAALTVLLIGGIGFIGYSVAEPVINYTQHKGDKPEENTTSAETTDGTAPEDATSPTDMVSAAALQTALSAVPRDAGVEFVEVPLKARGGKIYYATANQAAVSCGAVSSQLTLADIVKAIEDSGFKPAAEISTFYDNQLPTYLPEAGYVTVDDGSQWVDNDPQHGGAPWTTPTSAEALTYITDIIGEATDAGFERVICTDIMYPYFRSPTSPSSTSSTAGLTASSR